MFQCWSCEGEFTVDAPDRETWYTCPHCGIDNQYNGHHMIGHRPTLVQILDEYNENNLQRYIAKHLRNEASEDQVIVCYDDRNVHTSIGLIIIGSVFTAGLYLPFMFLLYLLTIPFTLGNVKPFFHYHATLLFDKAEQHFVVIEPRSGVKTPTLLIPARGAQVIVTPGTSGGEGGSGEFSAFSVVLFGKKVFGPMSKSGAEVAQQWVPLIYLDPDTPRIVHAIRGRKRYTGR